MAKYSMTVRITNELNKDKYQTIEITPIVSTEKAKQAVETIQKLDIHMDTIDQNSKNKGNAMLARIKIVGIIDDQIKNQLVDIFKWSINSDEDSWYRTVEIELKKSSSSAIPVRSYHFTNMFILDYKENYSKDEQIDSTFELELVQAAGCLDNISTF